MAQRTKELAGNHNCFGCVASADRRATLIIGAVVGSNIRWQWTPIRSGSCLIAGNRREPARVPCTCSTMSRGRHVGGAADAFGERKAACVRNGLKSQRKRRLTYAETPQAHDRLLRKDSLVIPRQLFGSLRHRSDWQGFAVGASSIKR